MLRSSLNFSREYAESVNEDIIPESVNLSETTIRQSARQTCFPENAKRTIAKDILTGAIPMSLTFTGSLALSSYNYMINVISQGNGNIVARGSYDVSMANISNLFAYASASGEGTALQKDPDQKSAIIRQTLLLGVINLTISGFFLSQSDAILQHVFGQSPAISKKVADDLRYYLFVSSMVMIKSAIEPLLFTQPSKPIKIFAGIASPALFAASTALSYQLGYKSKNISKLGIGLYTEALASTLLFSVLALIHPNVRGANPLRNFLSFKKEVYWFKFLAKKQIANLAQNFIETGAAFAYSTQLIKNFGSDSITAYSTVNIPNSFLFYLSMSIAYNMAYGISGKFFDQKTELLKKRVENRDFKQVRDYAKTGLLLNGVISVSANALFAYYSIPLAQIILGANLSGDLTEKIFWYAILYAIINTADILRFTANQAMLGLRNSKANTLLSIITPLAGLALGLILSHADSLKDYGMIAGWGIAIVLSSIATISLMAYNLQDHHLNATLERAKEKEQKAAGKKEQNASSQEVSENSGLSFLNRFLSKEQASEQTHLLIGRQI